MEEKNIKRKECRLVYHIPAIEDVRPDIHYIKELITYEDNTTANNIKLVKNFQRPFYITKPCYQNYKDKKESEELDRVDTFTATQSTLHKAIGTRLGGYKYPHAKCLRDVQPSPYLYGIDVSTSALIKNIYNKKYGEDMTPYDIGVLDIETDIDTDTLVIAAICVKDKIYTAIRADILPTNIKAEEQLKYLFKKHIPETELSKNIVPEFDIVETELDIIKGVMKKAHEWSPDILLVWNIKFDIPFMLKTLDKYGVDPKDIFADPNLPEEYKYFKWKEGVSVKVTVSGKQTSKDPQEQWHCVECPASFYWMDGMCAYYYVRQGSKKVPDGYSLDSILNYELGSSMKKLHFEDDDEANKYIGVDWHKFMLSERPFQYVIYNNWDVMSILHLDEKTKDYSLNVPVLSGVSPFNIFNSQPKRIIEALHFFYLENNRVLGCRDPGVEEKESLNLGNWIVLLNMADVKDTTGARCITDDPDLHTNVRLGVSDADTDSFLPI